jgi:hypothetical protein
MPSVIGDLLEALGPIVATPGQYLDAFVGEVDLDPVAVELDLVDPAFAAWDALDRGRERRFNEARIIRLGADRRRLLTLESHQINSAKDTITEPNVPSTTATRNRLHHGEKQMTRGRKQDRARVAGGQGYEVRCEAKKAKKSSAAVKKAVKKVGNSCKKVERRLAR